MGGYEWIALRIIAGLPNREPKVPFIILADQIGADCFSAHGDS
jgi:hypothetical protein